mmetsp:Transcript_117195/g.233529  ORF Transcript_117195/g.233529 Transcript_117195/m.233529 type:complete len:721 (-) Transcript_117195:106-2268(-)
MGNRSGTACGCNAQRCADQVGLPQAESENAEYDPAGAVFNDTLDGLERLDQEALRFAGTSNLPSVRWLLAMGAKSTATDLHGTTLLHAACRSGSAAVVQELLHHGVRVDNVDSAGWTPLHIAAVMGRRPVAIFLLGRRADPTAKNRKGLTPLALCSDPGTMEVLKGRHGSLLPDQFPVDMKRDTVDRTAESCVPFFVPRQPLFFDEAHRAEFVTMGAEILDQSVGHGLAFCVAVGAVKDRPTDLSLLLLEQHTNPVQLGLFLGEELSIAETVRLAFMDAMELFGTGVVAALRRSFRHIAAPQEFSKIDRLTTAIAHMWWRAHDMPELGFNNPDMLETVQEIGGMQLRAKLRSVECLQRLMFSTVMLCWGIHGAPDIVTVAKDHLSLAGFIAMNRGIELDDADVPRDVLEGIFSVLTQQPQISASRLVPLSKAEVPKPRPMDKPFLCHQGWASIPPGGLERHDDLANPSIGSGSGQRVSACIISEASSSPTPTPRLPNAAKNGHAVVQTRAMGGEEAEPVWLTLRFELVLFLSTSPSDVAPYAFLRLEDAVLREVDRESRHLILAGRPKAKVPETPEALDKDDEGRSGALGCSATGNNAMSWHSPFGDPARLPLQICFLLPDGRFQAFAALWLELEFGCDEDLDNWEREITQACASANYVEEEVGASSVTDGGMTASSSPVRMAVPGSPASKPRTPRPSSPPRQQDASDDPQFSKEELVIL